MQAFPHRQASGLVRCASLALIAGLPALAQAQFTDITQSGSASVIERVGVLDSYFRLIGEYPGSATLANLAIGNQTVAPTSITGPVSATLSTSVSPDLITISGSALAGNTSLNKYDSYYVPLSTTNRYGEAAATAGITFSLQQATAISVTGNTQGSSVALKATLTQLDGPGPTLGSYMGGDLYKLQTLGAGTYRLDFYAFAKTTNAYNFVSMAGPSGVISIQATPVPEPSTLAMWTLGGLMLAGVARRRGGRRHLLHRPLDC
jgi:PEP-CTERM motif